jgi:hypothetical protein
MLWRWATRLTSRTAESARNIDDQAYQQNQAKPAPTNHWTANVKPTTTKQEKQNNQE